MKEISFLEFGTELAYELLKDGDLMIDGVTKVMSGYDITNGAENLICVAHLSFNRGYFIIDIEDKVEKLSKCIEKSNYNDGEEVSYYFFTKIRNKKVEIWAENT